MEPVTRRELLERAAVAWAAVVSGASLERAGAEGRPSAPVAVYDWIRQPRILLAEAYNPPFYPSFDYDAEKALAIARELNADSLRYPAASYYAYFPTKTRYPVHPELGDSDPMEKTVRLFHEAGLRVVAYVPLNHPFMEVEAANPDYDDWVKRFPDGRPMTTEHYGYTSYYEGCLSSPLREQITRLVMEVLTRYPVDVMYFDGPYMGMRNAQRYCHCRYCRAAYEKARGKPVPLQDERTTLEEDIEYWRWLSQDVVVAYLREIREAIRKTRDVPVLFNDTSLLSRREWRSRAFPVVDGFMFEAAETPGEKLFNLALGRSTGKVIWTYVGTHTQYNREHLRNERVRGWFSYPVESEELLIDGATGLAGGAGLIYWGLSRFFYMPERPLRYEAGRYVKETFDWADQNRDLLRSTRPAPVAGILVGSQTVDWYKAEHFVLGAYSNAYNGAFQLLKDSSYDAEPFLDYATTAETLGRYKLVLVPNAACLSDAQCDLLRAYVEGGGSLVATHFSSAADEYGRARKDLGLADLLGVRLVSGAAFEGPDLYIRMRDRAELVPQDPQVALVEAASGATVLGETIDRGRRKTLGPAVVSRSVGAGQVLYLGSSLEAIYYETRMKAVLELVRSLLEPLIGRFRTYEVERRSGLMPHLVTSADRLVLHLLANTGNKSKKLRTREEFLPIPDVKVRLRLPAGRRARSVTLLRSRRRPAWHERAGWVELTVPQVLIHEAVHLELA
ncbi:MAG: hypothetical protein DMF80_14010 [Acidobacteria bacterium]|nr:MAG: hypothetical protein DMF80_14010 [Acidobacteriota bacterium]